MTTSRAGSPDGFGQDIPAPDGSATSSVAPRLQRVLSDVRNVQRVEAAVALALGIVVAMIPIVVYEELISPGQIPGSFVILIVATICSALIASGLIGSSVLEWIRLRGESAELDAVASFATDRLGRWARSRFPRWSKALLDSRNGVVFLGFVLGTTAVPLLFLPVVVPAAPWSSPSSWGVLASVFVLPELAVPALGYALVQPWVSRASGEISQLEEETDPLDWLVPPLGGRPAASVSPGPVDATFPEPDAIQARLRVLQARLAKAIRRQMLALAVGAVVLAAFPLALVVWTVLFWDSLGGLPPGFPTAIFVFVLGMPVGALLIGFGIVLRSSWSAIRASTPAASPAAKADTASASTDLELKRVLGLAERVQLLNPWLITSAGVASALSGISLLLLVDYLFGSLLRSWGDFVLIPALVIVLGVGLVGALVARAIVTWRLRVLVTPSRGVQAGVRRLEEDFWSRF